MKKILLSIVFVSVLVLAVSVFSQSTNSAADCKLDDINAALDNAIAAIKASPAYGHAAGHYKKAHRDLEATKKQLKKGCDAWVKGGEKTGKKAN